VTRLDEDAVAEPSESNWTESRFRQRLVGAAVVVALAVLLLPLWLDGSGIDSLRVQDLPEKPEIPAESPGEIPVPPPESAAPLESPPEALMSGSPGEQTPSANDAAADEPPQSAEPATDERTEPAGPPESDATAGEPSAAEAAGDESRDNDVGDESTSEASLPATSTQGQYVVQLGSFSDERNARGLAESVESSGFDVIIEPLFSEQGTVWRVRVGPYASRELAGQATERLRQRLGRDGLVMSK
jgi:DedD protein